MKYFLYGFIILTVLAGQNLWAQPYAGIPGKIAYQGILTYSGNHGKITPFKAGRYALVISIYDDKTAGTDQYDEADTVIVDKNGYYTVTMGDDGTPQGFLYFDATMYWLSITVMSGPEHHVTYPYTLGERSQITSVPYADIASAVDPENAQFVKGLVSYGGTSSPFGAGVVGTTDYQDGTGVLGLSKSATLPEVTSYILEAGVTGAGSFLDDIATNSETGVFGFQGSTSVLGLSRIHGANGVLGEADSSTATIPGWGVAGISATGYGVYGKTETGSAGYFDGDVVVTGNISKAGGSFKIDHPLDPANKFLSHSFVESPDMMNIYNGNVTLDANGGATVTLPDYFNALNKDFRYQLTAVGGPSPNLFVSQEISGNQFQIAGGSPGVKVSWQVTGVRQDAWANAHRIPVEEMKSSTETGRYLHPELFGQSAEKGLNASGGAKMATMAKTVKSKTEKSQQNLPSTQRVQPGRQTLKNVNRRTAK